MFGKANTSREARKLVIF